MSLVGYLAARLHSATRGNDGPRFLPVKKHGESLRMFSKVRLLCLPVHGSCELTRTPFLFTKTGNPNEQSSNLNPRPIEPAPAYENGYKIARNLLRHIELQLDRMQRPDSKDLRSITPRPGSHRSCRTPDKIQNSRNALPKCSASTRLHR